MSFDLVVWCEPKPVSDVQARQTYELLCEDDRTTVVASEAISAAYDEIVRRFPLPDPYSAESPVFWSDIERSDAHLFLMIAWPHVEAIAPFIKQVADAHGLVCYDPQIEAIALPPDSIERSG